MRLAIILLFQLGLSLIAQAQSTIIYADDFEGGATGWSTNVTEFDPDVTRFLGRFDNAPNSTTRTFAIPANSERVEIAFDFYRFDSWDNTATWGVDRFEVDIDGTELFSLPFSSTQAARSGTTGSVDWAHTPLGPTQELAFGTGQWWFDQKHRVTLTVNSPGTSVELTIRTDLNQGGNDESGGFDNFLIESFATLPVISIAKTMAVVDTQGNGGFATPGNEVEYTFTLGNTGGAVDPDGLHLTDALPNEITLFTGDLNGLGQPVTFQDNSSPASGLVCCTGINIAYADETTGPPVFDYVPATPYDANVTYIRISPSGTLRDSQTNVSSVEFKFRAQID